MFGPQKGLNPQVESHWYRDKYLEYYACFSKVVVVGTENQITFCLDSVVTT